MTTRGQVEATSGVLEGHSTGLRRRGGLPSPSAAVRTPHRLPKTPVAFSAASVLATSLGEIHMQVHCRLREIMEERGIKVEALHRMSGVGREAICALRGPNWQRVSRVVMGKLCGALNITPNDLFILNPEDMWAPIKLGGEVTIHYGSRSLDETHSGPDGADETILTGQYIGTWDMRAFKCITEYLKQSRLDVSVSLQEHVNRKERGFDPAVRESVRQIFERGNHVVIGSPIANQFTEEVVCHAYGVPPYTPKRREAFPYGFVWDSRRTSTSSFGWQGMGKQFGIWSTRARKLVAHRTMVKAGEGQDCALILVYRIFVPQARREHGSDKERVVICILGHSGAGTLAGAMVATDRNCAAGLYPTERGVPHMRAVRATYTRAPISTLQDNREVTEAALVEEAAPSETAPEDPSSGGGRSRRKKPARSAAAKRGKPNGADRSARGESGIRTMLSAPRGR
jgi:DNA-binding Xre family transcriptional regulator